MLVGVSQPLTQAELDAALLEFHGRYVNDCGGFVRDILGATPREWQASFFDDLSAGHKRISIRSSRGRGKTAAVAQAILWWVLLRFPQKTVVTAPAASTIIDGLWPEVQLWANRLPDMLRALIDITADRIVVRGAEAESFVTAKTAREDKPESLQGMHADNMLLIVDEASGASERALEALYGSMAGANRVMVLISNPTRTSGFFYTTQRGDFALQWRRYQISALPVEAPEDGVRAFQCTIDGDEQWIAGMAARYGPESAAFRVHVRGEFPRADDDTVIPLHLVEEAQGREVEVSGTYAPIWGVDVARFGDDSSALCKRRANVVTEPVRRYRGLDTMQLSMRIKAEYDGCPPTDRPSVILVDVIGIGAGVVDRLRELGLPVRGVNVSESPAVGDTYLNLRAELWFKALAWLQQRHCRLPSNDEYRGDPELAAELVAPKYLFSERGNKIKVEAKADIKKRGLPSPDKADAFVLTFAEEAAVAGASGGSWSQSWSKPLRRGLSIV